MVADPAADRVRLCTVVPAEFAGIRLDRVLAAIFSDYSRSHIQAWLRAGFVQVNGQLPRLRMLVQCGDEVAVDAPVTVAEPLSRPWHTPLQICYQDDDLLVVNKPVGMVVHPGAGKRDHTLMHALLAYDPALTVLPRAGIIHRLDKDTSGLLVVARNVPAATALRQAIQTHQVERCYETIVYGELHSGGTIDKPLARHPARRTRMAVVAGGKPAISHYHIVQRFHGYTHIRVRLETGRTHQIRVHLAALGHPVVGDQTYAAHRNPSRQNSEKLCTEIRHFKRQALHACRLCLQHPITGEKMQWQVALPDDIQLLLHTLQTEAAVTTANRAVAE